MEQKFTAAWVKSREAAMELGVRMRPVKPETALMDARRTLSGRRLSDGFNDLARLHRLDLSLEALATDRRYTALFSDEEVNEALTRLLEAGYYQL